MRLKLIALVLGVAALATATAAVTSSGRPLPGAKKCRIFPANNHWNQRVDRLPVAANSSAVIDSIGAGDNVHADFGSGRYDGGPIGIPYTTVPRKERVGADGDARQRRIGERL